MEFYPELLTIRQLDDISQRFSKERLDRAQALVRKNSSIESLAKELKVTKTQLKSWAENACKEG